MAKHEPRQTQTVIGKPCSKCTGTEKYATTGSCRPCTMARGRVLAIARRPAKHAAICGECAAPFTARSNQLYCSKACGGRVNERARDHRIKNREGVERFTRLEIFQRDDFICWLCTEPCEQTAVVPSPKAPTIDHVIPLAKGGEHSRANVRCAHFICNSLRGTDMQPLEKHANRFKGGGVQKGPGCCFAQNGEMKSGQNSISRQELGP